MGRRGDKDVVGVAKDVVASVQTVAVVKR